MVHKFACVSLKIEPYQLSKGALYRKIMQYWISLSIKHPSGTDNIFENIYLNSIIFLVKNIFFFTIFQLRLRYFVIKIIFGLKYFADSRFGMFLVQVDRQK